MKNIEVITENTEKGLYSHKIIVGKNKVDEFLTYKNKFDINEYMNNMGIKIKLPLLKELKNNGLFEEYTNIGNTCHVVCSNDSYIDISNFNIANKDNVLPKLIYVYGKSSPRDNVIYLNKFMPCMAKSIRNGRIIKNEVSGKEDYLQIGLSITFRESYFSESNDRKSVMIKLISSILGV